MWATIRRVRQRRTLPWFIWEKAGSETYDKTIEHTCKHTVSLEDNADWAAFQRTKIYVGGSFFLVLRTPSSARGRCTEFCACSLHSHDVACCIPDRGEAMTEFKLCLLSLYQTPVDRLCHSVTGELSVLFAFDILKNIDEVILVDATYMLVTVLFTCLSSRLGSAVCPVFYQ